MTNDRLTADEITLFMVLKSDSMNESQTVMGNYDEKVPYVFTSARMKRS